MLLNFEDALSGKKKRSTDEYLIKKKDPLILPPDYNSLPIPDTKKTNKEINKIESILNTETSSKTNTKKSAIEMSIEKELKKKN